MRTSLDAVPSGASRACYAIRKTASLQAEAKCDLENVPHWDPTKVEYCAQVERDFEVQF